MFLTPARLSAAILVAGFAGSFYGFFPTFSADLMATWLAGNFLANGQPEQVYPAVSDIFQMYPPSEWRAFMAQEYQYDGPVFPFLYPPIWAKLAEQIAYVNFWRLTAVALVINSALLMATVLLAYRATKTALNPALFIGLAVFFLLASSIGTVALGQNQPQIFVSFLLVLAIERVRNNTPVMAGAALALAAAIKIYPVFFALFWLFGREKRAFIAFVVFGAALGLTSVFWAGWPLHTAFIEQTRLISGSVLVTRISINVDAVVAQLFFSDALKWLPALEGPSPANPKPGWYSMVRPLVWQIASTLALVLAIAMLTRAFSRSDRATQASTLWPLALTVVALMSPISWVYYYIPAACFAPVLIEKLGVRKGAIFLTLSFGLILNPFANSYQSIMDANGWPPYFFQLVGMLAMVILAFGFLLALKRSQKIQSSSE